jgi:arylsulfatase A-like enzyme
MDYKNSLYDPSSRVPLVISAYGVPGFNGAGSAVTNITSHVDILPTLVDIAGGTVPSWARGASLAPFFGLGSSLNAKAHPNLAILQYHSNMVRRDCVEL